MGNSSTLRYTMNITNHTYPLISDVSHYVSMLTAIGNAFIHLYRTDKQHLNTIGSKQEKTRRHVIQQRTTTHNHNNNRDNNARVAAGRPAQWELAKDAGCGRLDKDVHYRTHTHTHHEVMIRVKTTTTNISRKNHYNTDFLFFTSLIICRYHPHAHTLTNLNCIQYLDDITITHKLDLSSLVLH